MNNRLVAAIGRATESVRANNLAEGLRHIQGALSPRDRDRGHASGPGPSAADTIGDSAARLIDGEVVGRGQAGLSSTRGSAGDFQSAQPGPSHRRRTPLPEVLGILGRGLSADAFRTLPGGHGRVGVPPILEGAQFVERTFSCPAGSRTYKIYIPSALVQGRKASGLIVMLHGCTQNPDDFAAGTKMNDEGELHGLVVAYPCQPSSANPTSCWSWFNPAHQDRAAGEPAIIAGITQVLSAEFDLDRDRVFVAGLSAGGAMAVVMGATYPDLYSAIGVHSGLPYKAANDVVTAFAAMRGDLDAAVAISIGRAELDAGLSVRTIVFHGSADRTVDPANADRIIAAAAARHNARSSSKERGSEKGRTYIRVTFAGSDGCPAVEYWRVQDSGHAWSGGGPGGSFTDRQGPNASAEMVRFFLSSKSALQHS